MEWNKVKQLEDKGAIEEFEKKFNYILPVDFKEFVENYNGARPNIKVFDCKESKMHVFNHMLSFNKNDKLNIWNINFNSDNSSDKYLIFGVTSFGDFLCFDRETNHVIYLEHETMEIEEVATTFTQFINSFYDPEMQNKR